MKKIYLLAFSFLMVLSAEAQYKYAPSVVGRGAEKSLGAVRPQPNSNTGTTRDLDIFYTNDFSSCADWETYNAFDEGYSSFVTGIDFQCGTAVPSGPAPIAQIASTTAENGYMMVDSDAFGSETATGIENCWFQNVNPIDCSGKDYVSIRFQTFYRMWDGGTDDGNEYCLLEVSSDGINWPDPTTFEVSEAPSGTRFELWPTMQTQDPVLNPTTFVFDISEIAANQSNVFLRFRWKGTYGYAWMVDDIEMFVTPENDLTAIELYNGDITTYSAFEYTEIPTTQVAEFISAVSVANYGYVSQTNVDVTFDLDGVTYQTIEQEILPTSIDTILSPLMLPTSEVGTKTLTVTLPADDDLSTNVITKTFEVTEIEYSHISANPTIQRTQNTDAEVSFGTTFIMNQDVTAGGIKVWIGSNTDVGTEVQAFIYLVGEDIQDLEYIGASDVVNITQEMIDANDYTTFGFSLSGAVELAAGAAYVVEIRKYESSSRLYVVADGRDDDLATVCFGPFGAGGVENWFIAWNFTPAIKLILDGSVGVEEAVTSNGVELSQNMPNPSNGNTVINYTLTTPSNVQFVVRDMAGRIVSSESYGTRASGKHTIQLNTNQYSSGLYTYSLIAGDTQLTKQMMVK